MRRERLQRRIVGRDEAVDRVRRLESFAGPLRRRHAGGAEERVPALLDVGRLDVQRRFRQRAFRCVRDDDDPALRVEPAQRQNQRPRENEVAERAGVEDQDVSTEHGGQNDGEPSPRRAADFTPSLRYSGERECASLADLDRPLDPPAAEDDVAVVQHDRLAGRDRALRLVEADRRARRRR